MKSRIGAVELSPAVFTHAAFRLVRTPIHAIKKAPTTNVVGAFLAEDEGFEPSENTGKTVAVQRSRFSRWHFHCHSGRFRWKKRLANGLPDR